MCYSLAVKRDVLAHRAFCVTDGIEDWEQSAVSSGKKGPASLIFVFTGQGAQWAQMGKSLIQNIPSFRDSIQKMDAFLQTLPDPPSWKLIGTAATPPHP